MSDPKSKPQPRRHGNQATTQSQTQQTQASSQPQQQNQTQAQNQSKKGNQNTATAKAQQSQQHPAQPNTAQPDGGKGKATPHEEYEYYHPGTTNNSNGANRTTSTQSQQDVSVKEGPGKGTRQANNQQNNVQSQQPGPRLAPQTNSSANVNNSANTNTAASNQRKSSTTKAVGAAPSLRTSGNTQISASSLPQHQTQTQPSQPTQVQPQVQNQSQAQVQAQQAHIHQSPQQQTFMQIQSHVSLQQSLPQIQQAQVPSQQPQPVQPQSASLIQQTLPTSQSTQIQSHQLRFQQQLHTQRLLQQQFQQASSSFTSAPNSSISMSMVPPSPQTASSVLLNSNVPPHITSPDNLSGLVSNTNLLTPTASSYTQPQYQYYQQKGGSPQAILVPTSHSPQFNGTNEFLTLVSKGIPVPNVGSSTGIPVPSVSPHPTNPAILSSSPGIPGVMSPPFNKSPGSPGLVSPVSSPPLPSPTILSPRSAAGSPHQILNPSPGVILPQFSGEIMPDSVYPSEQFSPQFMDFPSDYVFQEEDFTGVPGFKDDKDTLINENGVPVMMQQQTGAPLFPQSSGIPLKSSMLPLSQYNQPQMKPALSNSEYLVQQHLAQLQMQQAAQARARLAKKPPAVATDRFGLLGLLNVIRMTNPDLNTLALGLDLTALGLNLNSLDRLYTTFVSPFSKLPPHNNEFYLPHSYFNNSTPLSKPEKKISLFSDETLLFIFYSMPKDELQLLAAKELYRNDWRFHKELKMWVKREPTSESTIGPGYEKGTFSVFDPKLWERQKRDNFVLVYSDCEVL
ncbi:NOT2 / NOT3 / NOT5 family protein [Pelomyxa schiedti]|nr:NOT2 / NOT3 / NOT5 family protein [Pelomyxa schiedti]